MSRQPRSTTRLGAQRALQIALGLIWLLDGALQLQPSMFRPSSVARIIASNSIGQPGVIARSVRIAAHLIEPRIVLFTVCAAAMQMLIGLGLLHRVTVKFALALSFVWSLGVWWIGEGFGGLFTGTASPLTGAPGAALLYVLVGVIIWPVAGQKDAGKPPAGGVLVARGARAAWVLLWLGSAALWLLPANRGTEGVRDAIAAAPSGAAWLSVTHSSIASAAAGHGLEIAIAAASLSLVIGTGVLLNRCTKSLLMLTVVIALLYGVVGQGIGGVLTGSGTDPGTGPLLILLAASIHPVHQRHLAKSGVPEAFALRRPQVHGCRSTASQSGALSNPKVLTD